MEDELEDKILYQTLSKSHMKLLSKFAVGVTPLNSSLSYVWKVMRVYLLKPEVLIAGLLICLFVLYLQAAEVWSRGFIRRISSSLGFGKPGGARSGKLAMLVSAAEKHSWEERTTGSAVYAVQGRRARMEDRYVISENINNCGISLFAIFDGHGGEYAAEYAKTVLVKNINQKLQQSSAIADGKESPPTVANGKPSSDCGPDGKPDSPGSPKAANDREKDVNERYKVMNGAGSHGNGNEPPGSAATVQRRQSFRKSKTEDAIGGAGGTGAIGGSNSNNQQLENDLLSKYMGNQSPARQQVKKNLLNGTSGAGPTPVKPKTYEAQCYVQDGSINFGKIITDEVLAADFDLVEAAKRMSDFAGTTALIAVIHRSKLIVANVGDSRGVMCDYKGNAIPLSFDHKPQQVREQKRIADAGGFIAFKGVWRVAGILATSRALGDYPLKEKNLVIADPDILSFDLVDHRPQFLILASDGLWDTFTNEEAVAYVRERLDEPHYGAKSIALQSYSRGSVDNITVLVVVLKNGRFEVGSSSD
ncbi:protein phosphatase 1L [Anopheles ziemanni]|uniref:protein phosphatase 1L n=1 Tax=Anopheles coustani TaxID=139045 RepID=UPI00265A65A0|nr:protein phosphatase 1L [Anopheles coustani]XP_058175369.1 protein phosphatase 1L [Anopheles ziemanni]